MKYFDFCVQYLCFTLNCQQNANGISLSVFIYGKSFFGVRHGLETLSQLIALDASKECLQVLLYFRLIAFMNHPFKNIFIR